MGNFDFTDLSEDYYMVKFDLIDDQVRVFNGGPWIIMNHYLTVRK